MSATLDPLATTRRIASSYTGYLASTFRPRRPDLQREFEAALDGDLRLTRGPFLQASAPFVAGASLAELIEDGVVSRGLRHLPNNAFPIERPLYQHQEHAIRRAVAHRRNLVVATGTGSGKTECFLVPIIDRGEALVTDDSFLFFGVGKQNHPEIPAAVAAEINALQAAEDVRGAFSFRLKLDERFARMGWMRAAYLVAFCQFAYSCITTPSYERLR
jgi:hypothetical protein